MTFGVGALRGAGVVDHRLTRRHLVNEFKRGRLRQDQVCDAHPELIRAAQHVGAPASMPCPICDRSGLRLVTYVFGPRLPKHGRCVSTAAELRALDVVMTARYAALEPWWHRYTTADERRAIECLDRMGVGWTAQRALATLSSGEQQRVLLARTLMNDPDVVMLDEPSARLDLGGREQLVAALADLTLDPSAPPLVLVTHHLDEVPPGMTHVLMLRDGVAVAKGPIGRTLTAARLSECFGLPLELERRADGRLSAWSPRGGSAARDRS